MRLLIWLLWGCYLAAIGLLVVLLYWRLALYHEKLLPLPMPAAVGKQAIRCRQLLSGTGSSSFERREAQWLRLKYQSNTEMQPA